MVDLAPNPHQDLNLVQLTLKLQLLKLQVVRIVLDLNLRLDLNLVQFTDLNLLLDLNLVQLMDLNHLLGPKLHLDLVQPTHKLLVVTALGLNLHLDLNRHLVQLILLKLLVAHLDLDLNLHLGHNLMQQLLKLQVVPLDLDLNLHLDLNLVQKQQQPQFMLQLQLPKLQFMLQLQLPKLQFIQLLKLLAVRTVLGLNPHLGLNLAQFMHPLALAPNLLQDLNLDHTKQPQQLQLIKLLQKHQPKFVLKKQLKHLPLIQRLQLRLQATLQAK
jgi:hypothetical protein